MIRHVSIFSLEDKKKTDDFISMLEEVGRTCPLICQSQVGKNIAQPLPEGVIGPEFGDVIQIVDFKSRQDADAYPSSQAHQHLVSDGPAAKKVTAIDYEF